MFKKLAYKLITLGCLSSCLMGVAQGADQNDIVFVGNTVFPDVACNGPQREVIYTVKNNQPSGLRIYDIAMTALSGNNDSCVTTAFDVSGCITSIDPVSGGQGIVPGFSTCDISVIVQPPVCGEGPIDESSLLELRMGVGSQQGELTKTILSEVTVIGEGRDFAALDVTNPPETRPELGHSQLFGDLGIMDLFYNDFEVHEGVTHFTADNQVNGANGDFLAAYDTILDVYNFDGCRDRKIDDGAPVTSGYYCLSQTNDDDEAVDVTLSGTINLVGPGNFVFLVDPFNPECDGDTRMCNLNVLSTAYFTYSDGASAANVYWVLTTSYQPSEDPDNPNLTPPADADYSNVNLAAGSILAGSILAGAPGSSDGVFFDQGGLGKITAQGWDDPITGDGAAVVLGSLWAYSAPPVGPKNLVTFPAIRLAGTTVNAHVE